MNRVCRECEFFAPSDPEEESSFRHQRPNTCRRRPPVVMVHHSGEDFMFPEVYPTTWCGEFEPRRRFRILSSLRRTWKRIVFWIE